MDKEEKKEQKSPIFVPISDSNNDSSSSFFDWAKFDTFTPDSEDKEKKKSNSIQ